MMMIHGYVSQKSCQCGLAGVEFHISHNDDDTFENQARPLFQVEREGFPCSCGPQCANPEGRREFDETEVG